MLALSGRMQSYNVCSLPTTMHSLYYYSVHKKVGETIDLIKPHPRVFPAPSVASAHLEEQDKCS